MKLLKRKIAVEVLNCKDLTDLFDTLIKYLKMYKYED